ncbi:hypothetical protein [Streptomyces albipurpureus]|uniref:Acetyltransferase n=1 Tax=Streptomyces albipurpureus TaxID=2897419 RepID=A0ABT0UYI7_9ACTN|nr:hypothetical protein [Streptomyces sp. CWNU-1]MCM2393633.1 hypothetical protein [Streptomyces sp. CWNU-1]
MAKVHGSGNTRLHTYYECLGFRHVRTVETMPSSTRRSHTGLAHRMGLPV